MNGENFESPVFSCSSSISGQNLPTSSAHPSATVSAPGHSKSPSFIFSSAQGGSPLFASSGVHSSNASFATLTAGSPLQEDGSKPESNAKDKQNLHFSKMDPSSSISIFASSVDGLNQHGTSFLPNNNVLPSLSNPLMRNNRTVNLNSHISQLTSRMSSQEILNVSSTSSMDTHPLLIRNSSCDSSLSELTPTITPVNLIDSVYDVHSPTKDVLIAGSDYAKDSILTCTTAVTQQPKENTCSSNSSSSSCVLLNKLLQNTKPEPNLHIPLRISEFSKIPNLSLKVVSKASDTATHSNKPNSIASNNISSSSSDKINLISEYRTNVSTSITNSSMLLISPPPYNQLNGAHSQPSTENFPLLPDSTFRNLECNPSVSFTEGFGIAHTSSSASVSHNSNHVLDSPYTSKSKNIHIPHKVVREPFDSESMQSKLTKTHIGLSSSEYHLENRTEQLLLGGDSLFTSAPSNIMDQSQGFNFISDHQVLPQFSQISDLTAGNSKDSRDSKHVDILLSQIQPEDENDLALGSLANSIAADQLMEGNPSPVVSESSLSAAIADEQVNLPELPPSPLLATMSSDFLVGSSSAPKTPPCQQTLQAFLPNLSTDLTLSFSSPFLENSMSIDMSSFSEADVSFNGGPHGFTESLDIPSQKKGNSGIELNFTNALKQMSEKGLGGEQPKPKLPLDIFQSPKLNPSTSNATPESKPIFSLSPEIKEESKRRKEMSPPPTPSIKKEHATIRPVKSETSETSNEEKSHDEPLIQQVPCFRCTLCSYLCLEKEDMAEHMKKKHKKVLTVQKEEVIFVREEKPPDRKKRKVSTQKKKATGCKVEVYTPEPGKFEKRIVMLETEDAIPSRKRKKSSSKHKKVDSPPRNSPGDPDSMSSVESEKFKTKSCVMLDEDTNESSSTNESIASPPKKSKSSKKPGRPPYSPSVGITKFRKRHPDIYIPDDILGFRCGVNGCGLRMKEKENILYHRECHVGAFLKCPECKVNFSHWHTLAMHLWKDHALDMELHKCEKCDYKSYSYTKLMNGHFRSHSTERPFLCDVCGKDFKTAKQLRTHKTLHSEKNTEKKDSIRYSCNMCNRKFSEKRMLLSHLEAVHKKVKPYLCSFCGKSFASKSTLNLHIRKHTGEKPFACEHCEYRTSDHNSMRRHKMKHSNDKRYSCPYCDYSSIQSSTYKVHLRRKHEIQAQKDGIIFSCNMCPFKTVKRDNFLAHMGTHHAITDEEQNIAAHLQQQQFVKMQEKKDTHLKKDDLLKPTEFVLKKENKPPVVLPDDISFTPIGPTTSTAATTSQTKTNSAPTYYLMQVPHVVNIDVNNGDSALEVPQSTSLVNSVVLQDLGSNIICPTSLPSPIPGQIIVGAPEDYYKSFIHQLDLNDSILQLSRELISTNIGPTFSNGSENVIYVSTSEGSEGS